MRDNRPQLILYEELDAALAVETLRGQQVPIRQDDGDGGACRCRWQRAVMSPPMSMDDDLDDDLDDLDESEDGSSMTSGSGSSRVPSPKDLMAASASAR